MQRGSFIFGPLWVALCICGCGGRHPHAALTVRGDARISEINVRNGQMRFRTYRGGKLASEKTKDTVLSTCLARPIIAHEQIAEWQMVNYFTPSSPGVSPQFDFHGIEAQLKDIARIFGTLGDDTRAKREIARQVLTLWQTTGSRWAGYEFLDRLQKRLRKQRGPSDGSGAAGDPEGRGE